MKFFVKILFLLFITSSLVSCGEGGGSGDSTPSWVLTKTGVKTSYTDYDDGYYQAGAEPSFTRDDTLEIVTDNLHGLMWQDNDAVGSETYTWQGATSYCENLDLAGYTDWRLPEIDELESIMDYGEKEIYSTFIHKDASWSNTLTINDTAWLFRPLSENAMLQFLDMGNPGDTTVDITLARNVRCVRGKTYNYSFYRDNDNDIVYDYSTGLMWQDNGSVAMSNITFNDAVNYCNNLRIGGYSNWRLPNIRELRSIFDYRNLQISSAFTNNINAPLWSSSLNFANSDGASYLITIYEGYDIGSTSITITYNNLDGTYDVQIVTNTSASTATTYESSWTFFSTAPTTELTALNSLFSEYPSVKCVRSK